MCRYNAASNSNKATGANIKSGCPHDSSLDVTKKGSVCDMQSHSNGDHPNQYSNVGSNNFDLDSTTNHTFTESVILKNKSAVSSTIKYLHPPSTFQPMKGDPLCAPQQILSEKANDVAGTTMLTQTRDTIQELQIPHLNNHYHHLPSMQSQQQQLATEHDDSSLKKMAAAVPHCGSSNLLGGTLEGNGGNYSINGSASGSNHGSNHGSNGQNGSCTAVNAGGTNVESDNGIAGKAGSGDGSGSGSGSGDGNRVDQNKFSQREAALTKFRQKRKERCFRKKVTDIEIGFHSIKVGVSILRQFLFYHFLPIVVFPFKFPIFMEGSPFFIFCAFASKGDHQIKKENLENHISVCSFLLCIAVYGILLQLSFSLAYCACHLLIFYLCANRAKIRLL